MGFYAPSKNGDVNQYSIKDIKYFPTLSKSLLGNGISFKLNDSAISFRFLSKKNIDLFHEKLEEVIANNLENGFKLTTDDFDTLTQKQFLRDSDIPQLNDKLKPIVARYSDDKKIFNKHFGNNLVKKLDYICSNFNSNGLNKEQVRKDYEENILKSRKDFFDVVESNPLTQQQRLSVIRNNDINMVLAAAGTGKTSVMVAKALDLIDSGKAISDEILILAYNKDAATELTERLEERAKQANLELAVPPSISTFHALRNIIKSCGKSVRLSKFVEDTTKLDLWFTKWLENYIKEDPDNLPLFLSYQPVDPFQFKTKGEYDRYLRDNEYRTLQGERVRGYQELLIANWLFMNGIKYEYEPRYVSKRRIEIGFDYKPDFGLGDGVYLEHFGIDRQGRIRPDIDSVKYNADIEKKRLLHQEHNKILLETYHYNWTENNLYKRLEQLMQEQFIAIRPRTDKELRDDWQSIYRFSGSKLEVTTQFNKMIGSHTLSKLEKTYRYNNSIADTAGHFIMQNPEQYKKNVVTNTQVSESCVHLHDSYIVKNGEKQNNISLKAFEMYKKIREQHPEASIAVLARYRYLIKEAKDVIKDQNVKFWTFHGSKGLEADYCILLGFFQGKTGFPNENKEEAVIEALLPMLDDYPHSEELRLFYVALTRAKKESYLIADVNAPSEFINELLSPQYKLDIVSDGFKSKYRKIFKCPVCSTGYFVLKVGKFGNFYSCSSGSVCRSSPRICEKCGSPSVDTANMSICQNPSCQNSFPICDKYGRPMRLREGKFGKFWGCSGYGIKDDPCSNTRKYFM